MACSHRSNRADRKVIAHLDPLPVRTDTSLPINADTKSLSGEIEQRACTLSLTHLRPQRHVLRPADSESSEHLKNGQVRCSQKVRRLCTLRGVGGGDNTCRVCAVCDSSVPGASAPAPVVFLHNATGNPAPVHGDEPPHVELVLVFRPGVRPMYTISVPVHDMGKTLNISLQSLFEHTTGLWELVLTLGVLVYLGDVLPSSQHPQ